MAIESTATGEKIKYPDSWKCWFCNVNGPEVSDWQFTGEFDAFFHWACLLEAVKDPENTEATIIAQEFGLLVFDSRDMDQDS